MHHPRGGPLGWVKCPYGQPGDLLWVKETFWRSQLKPDEISWDGPGETYETRNCDSHGEPHNWRKVSSRYMPRWASRLTLRVMDVRVERLQAITPEDVIREGTPVGNFRQWSGIIGEGQIPNPSRRDFEVLWDSINAKRGYPWQSDPWVWVIAFEALK